MLSQVRLSCIGGMNLRDTQIESFHSIKSIIQVFTQSLAQTPNKARQKPDGTIEHRDNI